MSGKQSKQRVYLVGRVTVTEGDDSPGSSGVVLITCDTLQPHSHSLGWHFLWMDPSGVFKARIHPHWVVTSLEGLDASTEKHLQQIHAGHTVAD